MFGGFPRYLLHRLRFFLPTVYARSIVHLAEIATFYFFLPAHELPLLMIAILLHFGLEGFWWGALEPMRIRVRQFRADGNQRAANKIGTYWLRLSVVVAAATLALSLVTVTLLMASGASVFVGLYVAARVSGFAISAPTQTLHSSVYAIRRVYRPYWSIVAPDILHLTLVLISALIAAPLVLPVAAFLRSVSAGLLSAVFTLRTARGIGVEWGFRTAFRFWRARLPSRRLALMVLPPALAFGAAQASHFFLFLAYWYLETDPQRWIGNTTLMFLSAPLLDGSVTWARLFYFDLSKLDGRMLARFRRRLFRLLTCWSPLIGASLLLPVVAIAMAVPALSGPGAMMTAAALFLVRPLFAISQIHAFCFQRYAPLGALSLIVPAFAGVSIALDIAGEFETALIASSFLLSSVGLFLLKRRRLPQKGVEPLPVYIANLCSVPSGPGAWYVIDIAPEQLQSSAMDLLKAVARRTGGLGIYNGRTIVTWLGSSEDPDWAFRSLVGLTSNMRKSPDMSGPENGFEAVTALLPQKFVRPRREMDDILADFRRRFPIGLALDPDAAPASEIAQLLSKTDRRRILSNLRKSSLARPTAPECRADSSALFVDGEIIQIFVVPKTVPYCDRQAWRRCVRDESLRTASDGHALTRSPMKLFLPRSSLGAQFAKATGRQG